jgi:hypothetical protein
MRYLLNWEHQKNVFWQLDKTLATVEVTTATTITALNIAYLSKLLKWKVEQNFKKISCPFGRGINMHFAYCEFN